MERVGQEGWVGKPKRLQEQLVVGAILKSMSDWSGVCVAADNTNATSGSRNSSSAVAGEAPKKATASASARNSAISPPGVNLPASVRPGRNKTPLPSSDSRSSVKPAAAYSMDNFLLFIVLPAQLACAPIPDSSQKDRKSTRLNSSH